MFAPSGVHLSLASGNAPVAGGRWVGCGLKPSPAAGSNGCRAGIPFEERRIMGGSSLLLVTNYTTRHSEQRKNTTFRGNLPIWEDSRRLQLPLAGCCRWARAGGGCRTSRTAGPGDYRKVSRRPKSWLRLEAAVAGGALAKRGRPDRLRPRRANGRPAVRACIRRQLDPWRRCVPPVALKPRRGVSSVQGQSARTRCNALAALYALLAALILPRFGGHPC